MIWQNAACIVIYCPYYFMSSTLANKYGILVLFVEFAFIDVNFQNMAVIMAKLNVHFMAPRSSKRLRIKSISS